MSLHEFREAARDRHLARDAVGWFVVAAALAFVEGGSLAGFGLLYAAGVAVPTAVVVLDVLGVPRRVRKTGGAAGLAALGAIIVAFGVGAHAVLLTLVGVAFALLGAYALVRAVRGRATVAA